MKALVVDDEAPARAKLVRLLRDDGRFELAGEAGDGIAAVAQIEAVRPDLLLLDIQMPGLTGFEVLRAVGATACPKVIFSTAHDRYALEAFDAHAIDYLLKPYDADRFRVALDKACAQLGTGGGDAAVLEALLARYPAHTAGTSSACWSSATTAGSRSRSSACGGCRPRASTCACSRPADST